MLHSTSLEMIAVMGISSECNHLTCHIGAVSSIAVAVAVQYTSRAAQQYKQQLEKDVAKFDTSAYLSTLKGKPAEPPNVTTAITASDKEAVAGNGNASSRPSSQNGSASNLAALDDSSVNQAPASSSASAAGQGVHLADCATYVGLLHLEHLCVCPRWLPCCMVLYLLPYVR